MQPRRVAVADKDKIGYRIHVGITDQATIGIDTPEDIAEFEACLT